MVNPITASDSIQSVLENKNYDQGNTSDAGTLTGVEMIPISRGTNTKFQSTLTKFATFILAQDDLLDYSALRLYSGALKAVSLTRSGIAGDFVVNAADTTSADNGATIIVDAIGRRWYRIFNNIINMLWFQPVGDGVTDDTAVVAAAITLAAQSQMVLHWPDGYSYGITNINVHGPGYYYDWTGTPRLIQLSARVPGTQVLVLGGGQILTTTLTATSLMSTCAVTMASTTGILPGDIVRLQTNRLAYGDHRFNLANALSQLCRVRSVSGNVVTFDDPLIFDFPVAAITSGTAQAGTTGTITLASADASTQNQLLGYQISITGGTGSGQTRFVQSYNATTKVVDIGTTWTVYPDAPWSPAPDATSQYSVASTVAVTVLRPGIIKSLAGLNVVGYATSGIDVYGVQIYACDKPNIENLDLSYFSWCCLTTFLCYRPVVRNSRFANANHAPNTSGGLGAGHDSKGDFACQVLGCTAENCASGFEAEGGSAYLLRIGNTCTGGSIDYTGAPMWPNTGGTQQTAGMACHTGTFGVTDIGNMVADTYYGAKYRSFWATCQGNNFRGAIHECVGVFYSDRVTIVGNTYDDGLTWQPNTGVNNNENGDDQAPYGTRAAANTLQAFMYCDQAGMNAGASITIKDNVMKSSGFTFALLSSENPTGDLALTVTDNDVSIVAESVFTVALARNFNAGATVGLREYTAFNNVLRLPSKPIISTNTQCWMCSTAVNCRSSPSWVSGNFWQCWLRTPV
jgi:hypothetical protein